MGRAIEVTFTVKLRDSHSHLDAYDRFWTLMENIEERGKAMETGEWMSSFGVLTEVDDDGEHIVFENVNPNGETPEWRE